MFAQTEEAAVAAACSTMRVTSGRLIFAPLRGSVNAPVMTTVLPFSGESAAAATSTGRSSSWTSRSTPARAAPRSPRSTSGRSKNATSDSATFGPMSLIATSSLDGRRGDVLDALVARQAQALGGAVGGHRDREADQRAPQAQALGAAIESTMLRADTSPMRS